MHMGRVANPKTQIVSGTTWGQEEVLDEYPNMHSSGVCFTKKWRDTSNSSVMHNLMLNSYVRGYFQCLSQ